MHEPHELDSNKLHQHVKLYIKPQDGLSLAWSRAGPRFLTEVGHLEHHHLMYNLEELQSK